jgi:hypothetical protein
MVRRTRSTREMEATEVGTDVIVPRALCFQNPNLATGNTLSFFNCRYYPKLFFRSTWNQRGSRSQSVLYSSLHFILEVFATARVSLTSSSIIQRRDARIAPAFVCVSAKGSSLVSSPSAAGGGKATETSGQAFLLAASSVVAGRGSSMRDFFLAVVISSACGDGASLLP